MEQSRVAELRYRENFGPDEWDWAESLAIIVTVLIPEFYRQPSTAWSMGVVAVLAGLLLPINRAYSVCAFTFLVSVPILIGLITFVATRKIERKPGFQELVFRENGFSYYGPLAEKFPAEIPYTDVISLRAYKRATAMRTKHLRGGPFIAELELMPQEAYDRVRAGMRR